ncbi:MAG: PKD domain-containing protein, partial [Candidatus Zixiibacteriota bacterium]
IEFMATPPTRWDWRDYDGVTSVKNQKNCGACWAFAVCGPFEAALKIRDGITVDLSEQWLVSCNDRNWGCEGGNFYANDFHVWRNDVCGTGDNNGAVREQYFPYVAYDAPCSGCPYPHEFWLDDWAFVDPSSMVPSSDTLKQVIMAKGPIMVALYANNALSAYAGGIFNACENKTPNHAVTLVGWDDDFEGTGEAVWICKNSWGTDWGVDGYFYMPFGCSRIGYNAAYVEYDLPGVMFWADTTFGWVPLDVNFEAYTPLEVQAWEWDFGDGGYSYVETPPTYTYDSNGSFDVSLHVDLGGGDIRTLTKQMYIIAIADTIRGDTLTPAPGSSIEVVVNADNSTPVQYLKIPFEFANNFGMTFDSFSTVGCRTDYFEVKDWVNWDLNVNKRGTLKLITSTIGTSPDLPIGEGPVLKLYFNIPDTASLGQSAEIGLDGYINIIGTEYFPAYYGDYANYEIAGINGRVILGETCCMVAGDVDHDGSMNILDIDYFIDWLFRGGPEIGCFEEGDADGNLSLDLLDVDYMIDYLYRDGPPPVPCP